MKANFILGKKQVILAALVLILGAAVYLNWQFANADGELEATGMLLETESQENTPTDAPAEEPANTTAAEGQEAAQDPDGTEKVKMLGDAQLVSSHAIASETYFSTAKLARSKSRDEAIQTISTILDGEKLSEADKKQASEKAVALTEVIEAESRIENLIKAKGFEECVVYITTDSANVVVKSEGLDQDQATQIKNIVVAEGSIKGENVTITEVQ